jgi:hypothetical protein
MEELDDIRFTLPSLNHPGGIGKQAFFAGLCPGELSDQATFSHDQGPVAHTQDLWQFRGNEENTDPSVGQVTYGVVDLDLCGHVHPTGRLIQDEHLGLGKKPLGQSYFLLIPPTKRPNQPSELGRADIQPLHLGPYLGVLLPAV